MCSGGAFRRTPSASGGSGRPASSVDVAILMHYGMFPHNTEPPGHFVNYIRDCFPTQKIKVMARYEGFVYLKS